MGTPPRPWTQRVLELIEANPGIDCEEVIQQVTPYVPQGHAFRARENARVKYLVRYRRKVLGLPTDTPQLLARPERHPHEQHRIGARIVLRKVITALCRSGRVVRDGNNLSLARNASATRDARGPDSEVAS